MPEGRRPRQCGEKRRDVKAALSVASALNALAGALRYKFGALLLRLFVGMNGKTAAPELFVSGWKFIWALRWLFRGKENYGNRYRISWRNFAYMQLLVKVKQRDPAFVPPLRIFGSELLTQLAEQKQPVLIVTIHARLISCLNKMLEDLGITSSVIAISDDTLRVSKLFGLMGDVDIIPLNSDSLVIAHRKLKAGRLVCCCADFTVRRNGTLYHDRYIAESLFAFAAKARARVVYAVVNITEHGEVTINIAAPSIAETHAAPGELAMDFARFIADTNRQPPDWKVGSWALRASSPAKQYDNFCIRPLNGANATTLQL
jgi:hypothetical protein